MNLTFGMSIGKNKNEIFRKTWKGGNVLMDNSKVEELMDILCNKICNCKKCHFYFDMPYETCCFYKCSKCEERGLREETPDYYRKICGTHHKDFKELLEEI